MNANKPQSNVREVSAGNAVARERRIGLPGAQRKKEQETSQAFSGTGTCRLINLERRARFNSNGYGPF